MWSGWKRILRNIVVLVLGLGIGLLLCFEVLARLFSADGENRRSLNFAPFVLLFGR
jgi:hypothetical protein